MSHPHLKLTYALKNGEIVHISAVEKGLACGCACPACGETLVAKKGEKMMHHFAHSSGSTCEYGYESSLHLAAKDILSKAEKMVIPAVYLEFPNSAKEKLLIADAKEIEIEKVELETYTEGIIPDIVVYSGGKKFFVEIYVTHKIDNEKLNKIKKLNISTIEIRLNELDYTISLDELEKILLNDSPEKIWKYNKVAQKYLKYFYEISEKKTVSRRGLASNIDYCPQKVRIWNGKPYAYYVDDCGYCEYNIYTQYDKDKYDWILCSGKKKIADFEDLKYYITRNK